MRKNILLLMIISCGILGVGDIAFAGPVISSRCPQAAHITTPTNAGGFYMSQDCQTAYVLPPDAGSASVVGSPLPIVSLNACEQIQDYTTAMNKVDGQITALVGTPNNDVALSGLFLQKQQLISNFTDVQALAKEQALNINLLFKMNLDQSVQRYKNWNANSGINFQPVLLTNVTLHWTANGPAAEVAPIENEVAVDPSGAIGNGGFNARVSLPLATACNLADPYTGMLPADLDYDKIAGALAASVTYQYELQSNYTFDAEYNLSSLAQEIKNESTQGGFFSSSAMSSLIQNQSNTAWFNLSVKCDDSRVCTQVNIDKMYEIKANLVKQVLDNIVLFKNGVFQAGGQNPGSISDDGAGKAAKGLHECPNVYCQAAAVILDVANATFGGTDKTDSFIATHNDWAHDKSEQDIPVTFSGNMGFSE